MLTNTCYYNEQFSTTRLKNFSKLDIDKVVKHTKEERYTTGLMESQIFMLHEACKSVY